MFKTILFFILFSIYILPQTLLEENFDYSTNSNLTDNGWIAYSGDAIDPMVVESSNLSYTDYQSSNIGGSVTVDAVGEDVYSSLNSEQTSGTVYVSLLVNVSNATTSSDGDYFFGLGSTGAGTIGGRLYIKKSGSNFAFGISKTTGTTSYTGFVYSFSTTYLLIIKYIINSGSSNDDVELFVVSGTIPETEPTPTITQPTESSSDPSSISVVAIRQNSTTNVVNIDGIRVATSWAYAPLPVELISFSALMVKDQIQLKWKTATEINSYGFNIERLIGKGNEWKKVGFVEGYGNSNSEKKYDFIDKNVLSGNKYSYRLKEINTDGTFKYSKVVEVNFSVPSEFNLSQNYPNPFNPVTNIRFEFDKNTKARLTVYDVLGNKVADLFNGRAETGKKYKVKFDGSALSSGVYYYKLTGNNKTEIKKMILLK